MITTGLQARVLDRIPLSRASQPLRDANAHVLVIGIGKQPDVRELNLITRNPQDVKIIPSPKEVIINVHLLARRLIKEANKETSKTRIRRRTSHEPYRLRLCEVRRQFKRGS